MVDFPACLGLTTSRTRWPGSMEEIPSPARYQHTKCQPIRLDRFAGMVGWAQAVAGRDGLNGKRLLLVNAVGRGVGPEQVVDLGIVYWVLAEVGVPRSLVVVCVHAAGQLAAVVEY